MRRRTRQQEPIDRRRSLASVPVLNQNVILDDPGGDRMSVRVRVHRGSGFLDRFRPRVMTKRVTLDELGTFVVRRIAGEASVKQIIDAFVDEYRTNRREAELCIVEFLKSLAARNVISIVVP